MATLDLMSSGLNTVRQGQYRANTAAAEIARLGVPAEAPATNAVPVQSATGQAAVSTAVETARPVNLVDNLVELQQARQEVEAGAGVIDTAREVLGTLLDVTA